MYIFIKTWSPQKLFLADAIGATFTSLSLGLVLVNFNEAFGLEKFVFHFLAVIVIPFLLYSLSILLIKPMAWNFLLIRIAAANSVYCVITLGIVIANRSEITFLDIAYFIIEAIIILTIAYSELKYAKENKHRKFNSTD